MKHIRGVGNRSAWEERRGGKGREEYAVSVGEEKAFQSLSRVALVKTQDPPSSREASCVAWWLPPFSGHSAWHLRKAMEF